MTSLEIAAELREATGKGANRRLRRAGKVPAVLYGAGKEPVTLALEARELDKRLESEAFLSQVLRIKVGRRKQEVVLKDLQRDPATDRVVHVDFMRVSSEQELRMHIPLHFLNEEHCKGRRAGGVISRLLVDVEVICLPRDLPEHIDVDLTELDVGEAIHLSDLVLPEGVKIAALAHEPVQDSQVVAVHHPQKAEEVAEGAEIEAGEAVAVEGEAADEA